MTTSHKPTDSPSATAAGPRGRDSSPEADQVRVELRHRPRSVEGDEAYHRSVMEQAAIDIAAGW